MKYFKVYKPALSDEDAEPVAGENMLIVCDGLGATGQNKHEINGQKHTSAYFGSRCVSCTAQKFFSMASDKIWSEEPQLFFHEFKEYLVENLYAYISMHNLQKTIKGKSAELLPSTFAMALFKEDEDVIHIYSIWAGDSRIYLLSAGDGLQQLSEDDVEGTFDAMKSLGTSNMCNSISGEGEDRFYLNYKRYRIKKQPNLFLFAASDGCFDYLATPMDFEYLLEFAMDRMPDTDDVSLIGTKISEIYSGGNLLDDTTMAGIIFNETGSEELKQQYKERFTKVKDSFRQPTEDSRQGIRIYENDLNTEQLAANKTLRDLGRQVVPYACSLLDGKLPEENGCLKDEIYLLPCMAVYKENMQERNRKIEEFQSLYDNTQQELEHMKVGIKDSFHREYIPFYIRNEKITNAFGMPSLKKLVLRYREKERTRTEFVENIKYLSGYTGKILRNIQSDIECENEQDFQLHCKELQEKTGSIEINGSVFFGKEQSSKLYQQIMKEFLSSGKLSLAFNNAKKAGFIGFPETMKLYEESRQLKSKMDQYAKKIESLKNSTGSSRYINSLGNVFVNEFINIPFMKTWIPEDMYNKIEQYNQMCIKQDTLKNTIDAAHKYIDSLWKDTYKDTYELYNTVCGGRV